MNADDSISIATLTYVVAGIYILLLLHHWLVPHSLRHIPTVGGPSAPLLSYIGAFNFTILNSRAIIQEGYKKYHGKFFKVPMLDTWLVVVSGSEMIDELQRFPDDHVSNIEALGELSGSKYTLNHPNPKHGKRIHGPVVRNQLTRQLAVVFPDIIDETEAAFQDLIPALSDDWLEVDAQSIVAKIVGRLSNRVFVGLPMCRNEEYLKLAVNIALDAGKRSLFLALFPPSLKPLVAARVSFVDEYINACLRCIGGRITQRLETMKDQGTGWPNKPNDMLQWLIDEVSKVEDLSVRNLARHFLILNFAAIHTTSSSFTHALYHLAANPEILVPLREEIETVVKIEGWTKIALSNMHKLDSFMRESQRLNGLAVVSVMRKALKDLRFSDGTFVPAGTILAAAAEPTHKDNRIYVNADTFDPWRFSAMREEDGETTKHQFVSTSVDYMPFGHGRHACPGRSFAASELKIMMAYVVMNYDVKFENEGVRPPNKYFALAVLPNPAARVLFRKRHIVSL